MYRFFFFFKQKTAPRNQHSVDRRHGKGFRRNRLGPFRESFIGAAPLIAGTAVILLIGYRVFSVTQLADAVQRSVVRATGYRDRGVKVGNVSGVIRPSNHDSRTANCLVEISFLDRQLQEEARLRQQGYIDTLGSAISDAVRSYLAARGLAAGAAMGAEPEDAAGGRADGWPAAGCSGPTRSGRPAASPSIPRRRH